MRFGDYIAMAFRNIWRQKLRSSLTIFAVVIGATSVTIMLAAVFSLKGFMTSQFEANGTFQQVAVSQQQDIAWGDWLGDQCPTCVKLTDDLVTNIQKTPHVIGVSRQVYVGQFSAITYENQKLRTQQLVANDANGVVTSSVVAGRALNSTDKEGVITLTADYADKWGFKHKYDQLIGKTVTLSTRDYYSGIGSDPQKQQAAQQAWFQAHPGADGRDYHPDPVNLTAKIVGITSPAEQGFMIQVPLEWARGMLKNQTYQVPPEAQQAYQQKCQTARGSCGAQPQPVLTVSDELAKNGYSALIVKVDQSSNAAAVAKTIRDTYKVGAADAQTQIKQQLAIFDILGLVLGGIGGIGGISLAVAAVGVVNTMVMAILERTREIGVMRAVGARRSTVSAVFTFEASLLGFLGGVIGLGIGYVAVLVANPLINKQLSSNGIASSNIITLPLWLIIGVVTLTTVIGLLAGLYPARRAAKLDPVEALRYE